MRLESYLGLAWSKFQIDNNKQKLENDSNAIDNQHQDVFQALTDKG